MSRPPSANTGLNFRRPSRVSRRGSAASPRGAPSPTTNAMATAIRPQEFKRETALQQAIDDLSPGEHVHFRAGLRVHPDKFGDRRPHHQRRNRAAARILSQPIAGTDHASRLDAPAGPDRKIARGPMISRAIGADARRPAE